MNIPTFVDIPVIDLKTGKLTAEWKAIMQQLLSELITNASDQGLVAPSQTNANILTIESAKEFSPISSTGQYITQFGTILYDSTNNVLVVALNNAGAPQFHNIVTL